jgi:hypothetical protein
MVLEAPTGAKLHVKNESRFSKQKNTLFYSDFDADAGYAILPKKYFGQKNGLIDTCPLQNITYWLKLTYFLSHSLYFLYIFP